MAREARKRLDWRRAVGICSEHRGINGEAVDAWREEVWRLMRARSPELHREVLCGRMGLRQAEHILRERGYTLDDA
ncbi:hypothetical protein B0I33_103462 [Prauserella shujinwangii]|uniref:Uncharacterized protein n=1 Tax=Prauserella shujinwangii TaxID=1453103 RepID=A0A2T0LZ71_9PSEU|nr:hypothetical protein [Prauserella shujinwangii]PRX49425.1 hypothetical protein B0I33_103462 [Prauserella shujinwangii]